MYKCAYHFEPTCFFERETFLLKIS